MDGESGFDIATKPCGEVQSAFPAFEMRKSLAVDSLNNGDWTSITTYYLYD